ncbi:hypothetical protein WS71_23825 [Burkholderia mayonis]|uniref:Uncharacterized protein n=1 Tax=Burkholderia mayonis TaxID=1385591 RepID=A0A1B4G2U0_9BURK|nr:hypothetical protein WS71_23825 [Burkholderia mayonis]KVE53769.1 hypothetical protein WS71_06940 [Burkholderia mayonis]
MMRFEDAMGTPCVVRGGERIGFRAERHAHSPDAAASARIAARAADQRAARGRSRPVVVPASRADAAAPNSRFGATREACGAAASAARSLAPGCRSGMPRRCARVAHAIHHDARNTRSASASAAVSPNA